MVDARTVGNVGNSRKINFDQELVQSELGLYPKTLMGNSQNANSTDTTMTYHKPRE